MKLLGWGVAFLFAVWLIAFTWIKWSDLGCSQDWTICVQETGIWFRKLVLLEWASKWQPLLAGIFALSGGAATIMAVKMQAKINEAKDFKQKRDDIISHATYLSELFRRCAFFQAGFNDDKDLSQWTDVVHSIKFISQVNPNITGDLLYLWQLLRRFSDGDDSDLTMIQIRGASACADYIMKDIIGFYLDGGQDYGRRSIKAPQPLVNLLEMFEHSLPSPFNGSRILSFIRPMDEHIDFSGTSLVK